MQSEKVNFALAVPNITLDGWIQIQMLKSPKVVSLAGRRDPQNVFN